MAQVRWTPQAADDLEAITEFIAPGSPAYAVLFVINVLGDYRIIYRLQADVAEILTIHNGARLLDPSKWN